MNILKVVGNDLQTNSFISFITGDRKFLCLLYPSINNDYNSYFDKLDSEEGTYNKLEKLRIETDFINAIPENVSKFINLKTLIIEGSRFYDLKMIQVPISVEVLYLVEHTNLQRECIEGMDRLINLTSLYLDFKPFGFLNIFKGEYNENKSENNIITIPPNLMKLKLIEFHSSIGYSKEMLKHDWKTVFIRNGLFSNIRDRIKDIIVEDDLWFDISIMLE